MKKIINTIILTIMESEFDINLFHYEQWKKENPEIAKVYEELSKLRDKKYNL